MSILSFEEALARAAHYPKRHLLLGNGFSIACEKSIFTYRSLFQEANFASIPQVKQVFESLETNDFEVIIRALEISARILPLYGTKFKVVAKTMREQAGNLKDILVGTIAGNHPARPNDIADEKFLECRRFLSHFLGPKSDGSVYTVNYDLLLYWALMHDDFPFEDPIELATNDGFTRNYDDGLAGELLWQGESSARGQRIHYVHGALHLFDDGAELRKNTWIDTGTPLLEQTRVALDKGMFPLFVAEGESLKKLAKIKHSAYLYHSFKSFSQAMQSDKATLFIFGHSFSESDNHILQKVARGKIPHIFVSVHGTGNAATKRKAEELGRLRNSRHPLSVTYYDANSANVWG